MIRNGDVRVLREGQLMNESVISSLRHFRDEVNEMNAGTECGVVIQGFNDFEEGDIIEVHRQERGRRQKLLAELPRRPRNRLTEKIHRDKSHWGESR